jgi:outer membrane protein TolC
VLVLLVGCSTGRYRRQADQEVYAIVQQAEQEVFGHTNAFSIDTPYSSRTPDSILAREIVDDRLQTNRRVLTLPAVLDLAVRQSRDYQSQKERLYLTALTLTGERYAFGPKFFASTRATYARGSDGQQRGSVNSQVGVDQLLKTGGQLGLSIANDLLRYYTGDPRRSAITALSVNLLQPLLRGAGKYNSSVERLTQAERNVVYAIRSYSYFQDQFALDIVRDYFALLAQKNAVRNNYSNYLSQVRSTRRLEARKDRESASQVDLARQSELNSRNSYVNSAANYLNLLDQFKIQLGLPVTEHLQLDDSPLKELETTGLIPVALDADAGFRLAVERQLEILNSIDRFEDAKRKVHVAAKNLQADLNIVADASLDSEAPTDYLQFDPDQVRYSVGLQLNLPIDRLQERNAYRAALVTFETELRTLSLALDNLRDRIDRGLRTLEQRRQNYLNQQNSLDLANRRVFGNTLMLEAGRVEARELVESQNDQIDAQNAVTAALVSYQETRLQLLLDLGLIETQSEGFWFKDHLAGVFAAAPPPETPAPVAAQVQRPRGEVITPDEIFKD